MATAVAAARLRIAASVVAVCTLLALAITARSAARSDVPEPRVRPLTHRTFERTPERLERGKYLVNAVAGCFNCHSTIVKHAAPGVAPEFSDLGGGRVLLNEPDFLLVGPNITPDVETGAGSWTDDQWARAIREGIGHDGHALFPMMPYVVYKDISDEDLAAIVVYMRSIPPVHNPLPKTKFPAMYAGLVASLPQPIDHAIAPPAPDPVSHGRYLVAVAHCHECHTPEDEQGRKLPGMDFAGGASFAPDVSSANITPDDTGIGYFDEALFIKALRTGYIGARALHPPMPWPTFRHMTDEDLKSIFAYLRTVPPVHHDVDNTEPVSYCKRCNSKHGLGEHNDRYVLKEDKLEAVSNPKK